LTDSALKGRRICVHVGGSVAAFKAGSVITELRTSGAEVRVAMTASARRFITPLTLQSLSGNPVVSDLWKGDRGPRAHVGVGAPATAGTEHGMPHLTLAGWCDVQVVVAATANLIARLANGFADDAVTTTVLACRAPLLIVPAMETAMWENSATLANVATLRERGATILGPVEGRQASGELGSGRMLEPAGIVSAVREALAPAGAEATRWPAGAHVVVTAGGTREPIDRVRFIGNRSSGRMGNALAAEALARGAEVILITSAEPPPPSSRLTVIAVETAAEMGDAVLAALPGTRVLVMAAAVADQRPATTASGKLPKAQLPGELTLVPTDDILLRVRDHPARAGVTVVGFAAETDSVLARAKGKLQAKGLDHIVANDVGAEGIGMGAEDNAVIILSAGGAVTHVDRRSKRRVAAAIFETISQLPAGRAIG